MSTAALARKFPLTAPGNSIVNSEPHVAALVRLASNEHVVVSRGTETLGIFDPGLLPADAKLIVAVPFTAWDAEFFDRPDEARESISSQMFDGFLRLVLSCSSIAEARMAIGPWSKNPLDLEMDARLAGVPLPDPIGMSEGLRQAVQSAHVRCPSCGSPQCAKEGMSNRYLASMWLVGIPIFMICASASFNFAGPVGGFAFVAVGGFFFMRRLAKKDANTFLCGLCRLRFYVDRPL